MKYYLLLILFLNANLAAKEISVYVTFSPSGSFKAVSEDFSGRVISKEGKVFAKKVKVRVKSFKTGVGLRDEHFQKHLKGKKHPQIYITNVSGEKGTASGDIYVAGIKKSIKMKYKIKNGLLLASFSLNTQDFKLKKVKYLGLGVNENVKISVEMPIDEK